MATELTLAKVPVLPEEARQQLILAAAERVFGAVGYGDATMEEVARECGMAKKTVYRFFPDKAALFSALIASHEHPQVSAAFINESQPHSPERLRKALLAIARFVLKPRQLLMTRLVIADGGQHPELSEQFYRDCILKTHEDLAQLLRPVLPDDIDVLETADMLMGMAIGGLHLRALMTGNAEADIEPRLEMRITLAVEAILALTAANTR